ncbi:UDP-N-acetylmuramoyl-tripeptide--D-alanyl-D-alanine ligase [Candidatus Azambacteria bacterium]|nr:UDP-N-acetylmuramoyl-tripeptide--D-alanyl-D-alanine ligase [Candidatus Azambacteria bacterium]
MKNLIQHILATLARLTLARYKPKIIGITGNVGKTSTKEAVYAVVSAAYRSRKGEKSYNNELGMPLTILGMRTGGKNPLRWMFALVGACLRLVYCRYPEVLVLEMGVDKPGDMEYLLSMVSPDIAVFTSVGDMPVHVENFVNRGELIREKIKLAWAVPAHGKIIINADVPAWADIKTKAKAPVLTYGFADDAHIKIEQPEYRFEEKAGRKIPIGIGVKVQYKGSFVPFRVDGAFHLHSGAYIAGTACAAGVALGMHLVEISSGLARYVPPKGRLTLFEGIKGSMIVDDTYNASPVSTEAALEALAALSTGRKIAVLGDMLELGTYTEEAHRDIGRKAARACDILLTVGSRMRFAADEATAHGFKEGVNLFSCDTSEEAGALLFRTIKEGDYVLVKGSQGMRMEKAVKEIMAHPERAEDLLVRQESGWLRS